jgi:hypothetical protein
MSAAERMRRMRARKKAEAVPVTGQSEIVQLCPLRWVA